MIDRDPKFEIQYLISLVIAIVGSATAPVIRDTVNPVVASILIIIIMIHILVYTVGYTLKNASGFQLDLVDSLNDVSQWTLGLVSFLFLYYIGTIVTQFLWNIFIQPYLGAFILLPTFSIAESTTISVVMNTNTPLEELFVYGIPLILLAALSFYVVSPLIEKVRTLRNVEITLYPDDTRVYNNFRDGDKVRIKIDNNTGEDQSFNIKFTLPDGVMYKNSRTDETGEGPIIDDEDVSHNENYLEFFDLKYIGEERETAVATIEISHKYGTSTREIDLILIPD